jgi:hypothetical protein
VYRPKAAAGVGLRQHFLQIIHVSLDLFGREVFLAIFGTLQSAPASVVKARLPSAATIYTFRQSHGTAHIQTTGFPLLFEIALKRIGHSHVVEANLVGLKRQGN